MRRWPLSNRQFYQSGHSLDIDVIEFGHRGTTNHAGAVYHGIRIANQVTEAFSIFKITFDPSDIGVGRSFVK